MITKYLSSARKQLWGYLFIMPFLAFFILLELYPMLQAVYLSLFDYGLGRKSWIGLHNYWYLLNDDIFLKSAVNTFAFVVGVVPISVAFSLFVANAALKKSAKLAAFFRAAFYLPIVSSSIILSLVWLWIYNPISGIANYSLTLLGLKPKMWLADPGVALPSLIVVVVTWVVGQPIILFMAAMGNIPSTYYEAADIDGARPWTKFWTITIPLLKPTTLYVTITGTIGAFQTFAVVQLMTGGGPNYATSTIMYLLYETAFKFGNLGLASAMGVVLALIIGLISVLQFKFMKSDFEY